jgi:acyl-CoA synthetase (NDP forming)
VIFVPPIITEAPAVAAAVREALATTPAAKEKTILACFLGTRGVPESLVTLQAGKVPSYAFPEAAAIALSRAVDYGKWKRLPEPVFPQLRVEKDRAAKAISGPREKAISSFWLDASGVRDVLGAYGIRMPQTASAKTADDAARLAKQFGVPVAVKLESRTLTHKTEVGGVKLNVKDAAAQQAFYDIQNALKRLGKDKEMEGVVVQEMAPEGVETIVGVSLDPAFGHLLMYGLGGVAVEILKDVAWGVAPIADVDADRMIGSVKGSKMLAGFRGAPPADIPALKDVMLRVSQLVCDFPEIEEMDLNPVRVLPVGKGAIAVDARIKLAGPKKPQSVPGAAAAR